MSIAEVISSDIEKSVKKVGYPDDPPVSVVRISDPAWGDYTTNWALQVSREFQQSPADIAKKLLSSFEISEVYEVPRVAPNGFINFQLKPDFLGKHLKLILAEGDKFGSSTIGKGKKILLEYSSPNIAKPMSAGNLRNTNLGQSLVQLVRFCGYETVVINYLGDWGTQFGKLIVAFKKWGGTSNPTVQELVDLYVKFHQEATQDLSLEEAARSEFLKLEQGDSENRKLWEEFRRISLIEFDRVYKEVGAAFDLIEGESAYEKSLPQIVEFALKQGVAQKDPDGSVLIPLPGISPLLILKSDGATLYGTRDLAALKSRVERYHPNEMAYVVGADQQLYLRQLFEAADKLGFGQGVTLAHVSYGLTKLAQGRMSTRFGNTVTAEEILTEARKRAQEVLSQKGSRAQDEDLVDQVAVGAIKWNDLKMARDSEVVFDWDKVFSLDGNTGPYMQYSYARIQSILAKADPSDRTGNFDSSVLTTPNEQTLLRQLVHFPEVVEEARALYAPHLICNFSFKLAQQFSRFYEVVPVLTNDTKLKQARVGLVEGVGVVLRNSLHLLGINTPARL